MLTLARPLARLCPPWLSEASETSGARPLKQKKRRRHSPRVLPKVQLRRPPGPPGPSGATRNKPQSDSALGPCIQALTSPQTFWVRRVHRGMKKTKHKTKTTVTYFSDFTETLKYFLRRLISFICRQEMSEALVLSTYRTLQKEDAGPGEEPGHSSTHPGPPPCCHSRPATSHRAPVPWDPRPPLLQ